MFNTRVYRNQGGSEFHVASGGSITFDSGGVINSYNLNGSAIVPAGALETFQAGASFSFNTTVSGTAFRIVNGASNPSINAGTDAPTHSAPMGSLYIRANGSISGLYINITQDANGSTWRLHQQGSAIG